MVVYLLTGHHENGEHWGFYPIYKTFESAEKQRQIEIAEYTWNGECHWEFEIHEIEVTE